MAVRLDDVRDLHAPQGRDDVLSESAAASTVAIVLSSVLPPSIGLTGAGWGMFAGYAVGTGYLVLAAAINAPARTRTRPRTERLD